MTERISRGKATCSGRRLPEQPPLGGTCERVIGHSGPYEALDVLAQVYVHLCPAALTLPLAMLYRLQNLLHQIERTCIDEGIVSFLVMNREIPSNIDRL